MARGNTVIERARSSRALLDSTADEAEFLAKEADRLARRSATLAKAREFRAFAGLALRRKPGRLPRHEARAFARVVAESELSPWQLFDELLGALLDAYPEASPLDTLSWFGHRDPGSLRGDPELRPIIQGEENPAATLIARGPAGNSGGSQQ
jgi:hypothetical protein